MIKSINEETSKIALAMGEIKPNERPSSTQFKYRVNKIQPKARFMDRPGSVQQAPLNSKFEDWEPIPAHKSIFKIRQNPIYSKKL